MNDSAQSLTIGVNNDSVAASSCKLSVKSLNVPVKSSGIQPFFGIAEAFH
jgi:hypothetical protein